MQRLINRYQMNASYFMYCTMQKSHLTTQEDCHCELHKIKAIY